MMDVDMWKIIITVAGSVLASSGFWAVIQKRGEKKDVKTQLLLGLAHDRIVYLATQYVTRQWITKGEYENLHKYLYTPYVKLGGNGTVTHLMADIDRLRIKPLDDLINSEERE